MHDFTIILCTANALFLCSPHYAQLDTAIIISSAVHPDALVYI